MSLYQSSRMRRPRYKIPITDSASGIDLVELRSSRTRNYAFTVTKGYINNLGYPVTLIDRNNFAITIPMQSRSLNASPALVVEVTIEFSDKVRLDTTDILNHLTDVGSRELALLKEGLNNNSVSIKYATRKVTLAYTVDSHVLRSNDYNVHITEIDMVICRHGEEEGVVHPYSKEGQVLLVSESHHQNLFTYRVLINDPDNIFGERYMNINNLVYRIPTTVDYGTKPGVYVYAKSIHDEDTVFYSFADADEALPLYASPKLAEMHGDPKELSKLKLEQLNMEHKSELLEKEHEFSKFKADIKQKELIREEEHSKFLHDAKIQESKFKNLETEYKRLTTEEQRRLNEQKAQLEKLKHDLDMRALGRKDSSEMVKWLPALITGIAALFAAFAKLTPTK